VRQTQVSADGTCSSSIVEIKDATFARAIDFCDIPKFSIGDDNNGIRHGSTKLQIESNASLATLIEMIVL
jgi:hypothetical protein